MKFWVMGTLNFAGREAIKKEKFDLLTIQP